ncbi:MAG: FecR domain-containing protein [Reichenbachiella sp.]|uniref:FecR family protein n=1 Tax=Reichenbachiella sp. TaxID=2184521 RepID=UPI0032669379
MDDRIYQLICLELSGEASEVDSKELGDWLAQSEQNRSVYQAMSQYWISTPEVYTSKKQTYSKLKKRIDASNQVGDLKTEENSIKSIGTRRLTFWMKAAAIFVVALGLGWTAYVSLNTGNSGPGIEMVVKQNPTGQKSTIFLSDGSKVVLNADSKVSYKKDFSSKERVIKLEGEAFFEVAKDSLRPFRVVTGEVTTIALGTSFNIDAFPERDNIEISLATGKVEVKSSGKSSKNMESLYLEPGERASYTLSTQDITKQKFDLEQVLAWKDGIIYFKNANQKMIIEKLERWYGVQIEVVNDAQKTIDISTKFENASLSNVLKSLGYTLGFEYNINDKKVNIEYLN